MKYAWTQIGTSDPWKDEAAEMHLFLPENIKEQIHFTTEDETITYDDIEQDIYNGDEVEIVGTLVQREDGNLIVKLEKPALFHGEYDSYVIEDVGLTGTNNLLTLGDTLNKKVSIYGMAIEAHTAYHYDDVMIIDGYSNLKVLEFMYVQRINNYSASGTCTTFIIPEYEEDVEIGGQEYLANGQKRNSFIYEYDENGNMVKFR